MTRKLNDSRRKRRQVETYTRGGSGEASVALRFVGSRFGEGAQRKGQVGAGSFTSTSELTARNLRGVAHPSASRLFQSTQPAHSQERCLVGYGIA